MIATMSSSSKQENQIKSFMLFKKNNFYILRHFQHCTHTIDGYNTILDNGSRQSNYDVLGAILVFEWAGSSHPATVYQKVNDV